MILAVIVEVTVENPEPLGVPDQLNPLLGQCIGQGGRVSKNVILLRNLTMTSKWQFYNFWGIIHLKVKPI